jgi:hypothetical protein
MNATISVTDFAAAGLLADLGAPASTSSPEGVDHWTAGMAQAVELARSHKLAGPGTLTFGEKEIVVTTRRKSIGQPIDPARVAQARAARLAKTRKVVQVIAPVRTAPPLVKAAAAVAAVVKGVSTVVGSAAPKPAAAAPKPAPAAPTLPAHRMQSTTSGTSWGRKAP